MSIKTAAINAPAPAPEPVATIEISVRGSSTTIDNHFSDAVRDWPCGEYKLYTHPPTTREPLTEKQLANVVRGVPEPDDDHVGMWVVAVCRAIESAHGIGAQP